MPSLYTEIEIDAPKHQVWQVLFRKDKWKYWNTFLFDCEPKLPLKQGKRVCLSVRRLPDEEEAEFEPLITRVQPDICLAWVSSIPGFCHECVFDLQEIGVSRTKYVHKDRYAGVLSRVFVPFIRDDQRRGMQRMARELKRYVEQWPRW